MKRLAAAAALTLMILGPSLAHANHHPGDPSGYCDGTAPGSPPVKYSLDSAQPSICFGVGGGLKGAVWADMQHNSIVVDGDPGNANTYKCFGGYAGVYVGSGTDAHLVWSPTGNYDPNAPAGGLGSSNHTFNPTTEYGKVKACFVG